MGCEWCCVGAGAVEIPRTDPVTVGEGVAQLDVVTWLWEKLVVDDAVAALPGLTEGLAVAVGLTTVVLVVVATDALGDG